MYAWITSWFVTNSVETNKQEESNKTEIPVAPELPAKLQFSGPARNAPNDGKNIKKAFDINAKQIVVVSLDQITMTIANLRKVNTEKDKVAPIKPLHKVPSIRKEFDEVCNKGVKTFFETLKERNSQKLIKLEDIRDVKIKDELIAIKEELDLIHQHILTLQIVD